MELGNTSAVAFGGDSWLAVTGKRVLPSGEPCDGCEVLRVFSIEDLTSLSPQHPETRLVALTAVELNGDVKSMSMSWDGAWLATGGDYAALYDFTDLSNAHQVRDFLSAQGDHCQNSADINSVGVMPILSSDGALIAVPTCDVSFSEITSVKTYNIGSAGATTLHGSVDTPDSTTHIAMSDGGDWLIIPQSKTNNSIKLYTYLPESKSWTLEMSSDAQKIELPGKASEVSVSVSNFETGTLAVGVGPPVDATGGGEIVLATLGRTPVQIQDLLVRGSIGKVSLSQNGQYLASWETWAGVYDLFGYYVCHTFQSATYDEVRTPFALSRIGGWFAEATAGGVTLYKIRSTDNSCTMTQEAYMPLQYVSVVAFGGEDWLAVSARSSDGCTGGCQSVRVYSLKGLLGLEGQEDALEVLAMAV